MNWIYLSPHFDDTALSCGGLVWEQARAGGLVSIWTLCAGEPPEGAISPFAESLHERWETGKEASLQRRKEDIDACSLLGAAARHFSIPDCIYRRAPGAQASQDPFLYDSEESLFGPLHPAEISLIHSLSADLAQALPAQAEIVCPLTMGGHVDHRLTFAAATLLGRQLWYYADYPYVLQHAPLLQLLHQAGWESFFFPISPQGLEAWVQSVAAYASQISTFWTDFGAIRAAVHQYSQQPGGGDCGVRLWRIPPDK